MKTQLLLVILVLYWIPDLCSSSKHGHFYGGSISFSVDKLASGKRIAQIELVTGWILGKGPCGPQCTKADVGRSTKVSRQQVIATMHDPMYFGNFSSDFPSTDSDDPEAGDKNAQTLEKTLNSQVMNNYTEVILGVSEHAKWEQELLTFSFELEDHKGHEDFNFEGHSWRNLTLQGTDIKWHMQARIAPQLRSDTNMSNNCPQVLSRPFYRVKLNTTTIIKIPTVDKDNDLVRCFLAKFIEGGGLSDVVAPGVSILKEPIGECTIAIDTTDVKYRDDVWIGIPVTVRDFNKESIQFGSQYYEKTAFSMCSTSIQFVVNVKENLVTPEFVDPSLEGNHEFYLYAETTWTVRLFAQAPENSTIEEFVSYARNMEAYQLGIVYDVPSRTRVRYTEVSWSPSANDVGRHIACFACTDTTGVDSAEERCFILNVKAEKFNHTHTSVSSGMSFLDIPSPDDLIQCPIDSTCVIPIFVNSSLPVVKIAIKESFSDDSTIGNVTQVQHNGEAVYKADLAFSHSMSDQISICFQATDNTGTTSDTVCIKSEINAQDPCFSSPCKNSGVCKPGVAPGSYNCICPTSFSGKNCEDAKKWCHPSPCLHGICYNMHIKFVCYCKDTGYTGTRCETNIDECTSNPCNNRGICVDGINEYKCDCFNRYHGLNCENDTCPTAPASMKTCPVYDCLPDPCGGHGVCSSGPICTCSLGYSGANCSSNVGDISNKLASGVEFLPPSPADGSKLTCYTKGDTVVDCPFTVFVGTKTGVAPTLTMDDSSGLSQHSSIDTPTETHLLDGITHLYTSTVTLKGNLTDKNNRFICLTASLASDSANLCLDLEFVNDPTTVTTTKEYGEKDAAVQFVPPTPLANSRFLCEINQTCSILLYTTYNDTCMNVITSSTGVTVMNANPDGSRACVSESLYQFETEGEEDICFLSSDTDNQERCFKVGVYETNKDPCASSPCQNEAQCFTDGHSDYKCICKDQYVGDKCEKGPCLVNNCKNGGYCSVNNMVNTCICPAAFVGTTCGTELSGTNLNPNTDGAVITDILKPTDVYCNKNLPCGASLLLTGDYTGNDGPNVAAGYVSQEIILQEIVSAEVGVNSGTYEVGIPFIGKEIGDYSLCIQTLNNDRVNKDEVCFNVHVISGSSSLYGYIDRPHYVQPSPPTDTTIQCIEHQQCHMMYHVTSGVGHENECVSVTVTERSNIDSIYPFTTCDPCTDGTSAKGNCSIDISFVPESTGGGNKKICVMVGLKSAGTDGEKRCFSITVLPAGTTLASTGCQALHCENGGFCDSQDPANPVCYCAKGYSGTTCTDASTSPPSGGTNTQSFIGDSGVPTDIMCSVGCPCTIPFHLVGKSTSTLPDVSVGFSDPRLDVSLPVIVAKPPTSSTTDYSGTIDVQLSEPGVFKMCLQIKDNALTEDEMCFTVHDTGSCGGEVDKDKPHFLQPTLPKDSSVLCSKGQPCHLDIHFTNGETFGLSNLCPSIKDTSSQLFEGAHIFPPTHNAVDCSADVTFVSPVSAVADEPHVLCLKVSLPGKQGEQRCFTLKVTDNISNTVDHPCRGISCAQNGVCVANMTSDTGMCVCMEGFSGADCSTVVNLKKDLPGVTNPPSSTTDAPHFDPSSTVPQSVTCEEGVPCKIIIPFIGDSTKPPIPGYFDPNVTKQSTAVSTPDPGKPSEHLLITTITGSKGPHKVCFQTTTNGTTSGTNVDEVCVMANMNTPGSTPGPTDPAKPTFSSNAPASTSTFLCQENSNCHHTVITEKPTAGTCAQVAECGSGVTGVHVFQTREAGGHCITDIGITTGGASTQTLCVTAGKPGGEQRKYDIVTESTTSHTGCQALHCENGGFCDSRDPAHAVCYCTKGYSGATCTDANTGSKSTGSNRQTFIGDYGVPTDVPCSLGCTCTIPFQLVGKSTSTLPDVILGYASPMLTTSKPVLTTRPPAANTLYYSGTVDIELSTSGSFKVCLQIKDTALTEDEMCFTVHDAGSCGGGVDNGKPYFLQPTMSNESIFLCNKGQPCHLDIHFTNGETFGLSNQCPSLKDTSSDLFDGVHIFQANHDATDCSADVTYVSPATVAVDETHVLCLTVSLPGKQGERRCFTLKVTDDVNNSVNHLCRGISCVNNGVCVGNMASNTGVCVCPAGFSGTTCVKAVDPKKDLPGVINPPSSTTDAPHFDPSSLVPQEVTCEDSVPCKILIPFTGDPTKPPVPGYFDPNVTKQSTAVSTPDPGKPSEHLLITTITGSRGPHKVCFQTTTNGTTTGDNVDELCVTANIKTPGTTSAPTDPTKPTFSSNTPTSTSSFLCPENSNCHHSVVTEKPTSGTCAQVAECGSGVTGVHVFQTREAGGHCVTDIGITTGGASTQTLCVTAGKPGGEERQFQVVTDTKTSFGPCQHLHCTNGASCLSMTTTPICHCLPGFTGTRCETDINDCVPDPCLNGGTCSDGVNTYTCSCKAGFTGVDCNTDIDDCATNPCQHESTCEDHVDSYTCQCKNGITGTNCETDIDECSPDPCKNGATCIDGINMYTCTCKPGYTGTDCATDIDDCVLNTCHNGGSCVDGENTYTCTCPQGFTGHDCVTDINECLSTPCKNDGTCVDGLNNYTCSCKAGFEGQSCETNIDECAAVNCEHGGTCIDGIASFQCQCVLGHVGTHCEIDDPNAVDECAVGPCRNGATCIDGMNSYTCACASGYTDSTCATDIDDCLPDPCLNGGTCADGVNKYTCSCKAGLTGVNCQTDIDDCNPSPCQNGASCQDGINNYRCTCVPGFEGINCQTNSDECAANSCQHGATCKDSVNSYMCDCIAGYTGHDCEQDIDDCAINPCVNGGTCNDFVDSFTCTCPTGFTGRKCETDIDDCQTLPCEHGASCSDLPNSYTCTCPSGYEGPKCEKDKDDCITNLCQNGGTCVDGVDMYTCSCPVTHEGTHCEAVSTKDDCPGNQCQNGATCLDGVNSYTCRCTPGFTGNHCEHDIDDCAPNPCQHSGTCTDLVHSYTCTCLPGYTGTNCQIDIDECQSFPCQHGGTCKNEVNKYSCACVTGYTGINCEQDIDDCVPSPCEQGGTCTDGINDFMCICVSGYSGKRCQTDIDECLSTPCHNRGTCTDGIDMYTCSCQAGFSGTQCEVDIDDCNPSPCQNGGTCQDDVSDYTCSCVSGYTGKNCQTNIDNCVNPVCQNGGSCFDGVNKYTCTCPTGWEGDHCETASVINECDSNPCQHQGTCHDGTNKYTCSCEPGRTGQNCETEINKCDSHPCQHGGSCTHYFDSYTCACVPGYTDQRCETDINECISSPCHNGGTCQNDVNKYTCQCASGFTGVNCDIDIDECASNPCHNGTCQDLVDGYKCTCIAGYLGSQCKTDIDECGSNPCKNGGTCSNEVNKFQCTCPSGFEGTMCEAPSIINECVSNPCKNGGTCHDGIHKYTCACLPGFTGVNCDQDIDDCTSSPCENGGTCTDTGAGTYTCACRPGFKDTDCHTKTLTTLHNISPTNPNTNNHGPAFTQFTIPEVVRCPVNKKCSIILPVAAEPGKQPNVQSGHYSPVLRVDKPVIKQSTSCNSHVCYFQTLISVTPTRVGQFKYCIQTLDTHNINADELCYIIESYFVVGSTPSTGFVQPPTMPNNSTMSCTINTTCQYTIVTKSPCPPNFTAEDQRSDIYVYPPRATGQTCEYKVLVSPNNTQAGKNISMCFRLAAHDRHCTYIHVQDRTSIEHRAGQCFKHHCVHGFCDSTQPDQSSCVCAPGYTGTDCDTTKPCSIGSIPKQITCNGVTDCKVHFVTTGATPPNVNATGPVFISSLHSNMYAVGVDASLPKVCFDVNIGGCQRNICVDVVQGTNPKPSFPTEPSLVCTIETGSTACSPMTVVSIPVNDTCPPLVISPDTTMQNVHIFGSHSVVDGKCFSSVVATPDPAHGETDKLCLIPGNNPKKCLTVSIANQTAGIGMCDVRKAPSNAQSQVKDGLASCTCTVNGKAVYIIKKRPVAASGTLVKAAGFGAGGATGSMIVGVVIYLVINKLKKKAGGGRRKPASRPPSRIHPDKNKSQKRWT